MSGSRGTGPQTEFLKHFLPVRMVAFCKDGQRGPIWDDFDDAAAAMAWGEQKNQAGFNIYYMVNQLWRDTPANSRGGEEDVGWLRAVPIDLDPKGDWEAAQPDLDVAMRSVPGSFYVHSGRGRQVIRLFSEPVPIQAYSDQPPEEKSIELHTRPGRALIADLRQQLSRHDRVKVDGTADLPRVMRCPGFVNWKTGERAYVIEATGKRFEFEVPAELTEETAAADVAIDFEHLPTVDVQKMRFDPEKARVVAVHGWNNVEYDSFEQKRGDFSRNEYAMEVTGALVRGGHSDEEIAAVLFDEHLGISDFARYTAHEKNHNRARRRRSAGSTRRTIERAIQRARADQATEELQAAGEVFLHPAAPLDSARAFLDQRPPLIHWGKDWYEFHVCSYRDIEAETLNAEIWRFCGRAKMNGKDGAVLDFHPNRKIVGDIIEAIRSIVHREHRLLAPGQWIRGEGTPVTDLLPVENGLLNVRTGGLLPPTPDLFILNHRPFRYDSEAACPLFLRTLDDWFEGPDKQEQIRLLQEWFGYCLTPDTSFQKALNMTGVMRAGKGTVMTLLEAIIGEEQVDWKTAEGLQDRFGLESFLGKHAVFFDEVRVNGRLAVAVTSHFLALTGGSKRTVQQKGLKDITGTLALKFIFATNQRLRLPDPTGTVATRFVSLHFRNSFLGKEDRGLKWRLLDEIEGIVNWAIDGYLRLQEQGQFTDTEASKNLADGMLTASSDIVSFVEECCIVTPTGSALRPEEAVEIALLWFQWGLWCDANNVRSALTRDQFIEDLRATYPQIPDGDCKITKTYADGKAVLTKKGAHAQVRAIRGIRLRPEVLDS